jgi:hypothetical protein
LTSRREKSVAFPTETGIETGMGCGGHNARDFKGNRNSYKETYPHERLEDVIDLSEDDYTVLPSRDEKIS